MVAITEGQVLYWDDIKKNLESIRTRQIDQLIQIYNHNKEMSNFPFKWGDEMELTLIKFDHTNKKCYLLLKSEEFFEYYNQLKKEKTEGLDHLEFHNEYTSYIIETIPGYPVDGEDVNSLSKIQENIKKRRQFIADFLEKDEHVISLTSFSLLGCHNFTYPHKNAEPDSEKQRYNSLFYSNEIIMQDALFLSATYNKIDRINSMPRINVPIFRDTKTPNPFIEKFPNFEDGEEDNIFMDHDGFAMGCCCIQVTFQGSSLEDAQHLYDQLTPISPLVLALSASSPIWRGYLSDIDCRWNVIKQAFDDRTQEELGKEPLKNDRYILKKGRFDTTDCYLSAEGSKYNDFKYDRDENVYNTLITDNMDPSLAGHFANMFTRDPMLIYEDDALNPNLNDYNTNAFDLFNCSNWRLLRFKPPSIHPDNKIGWRVEFRPTELQFTDFENSAFATFIILLTRTITQLKLNFLIGTSKVAENMDRAQERNAALNQKFYFRQNVEYNKDDAIITEMSLNEIMNGCSSFKGLLFYIREYLKTQKGMSAETKLKIESYLMVFKLRASGVLKTPASWIREFVRKHKSYNHDSKINEEINYDLMWKIYEMSINNIVFDENNNKLVVEK